MNQKKGPVLLLALLITAIVVVSAFPILIFFSSSFIQISYAQFPRGGEEPTMTTALDQSNNTSSGVEGSPTIISLAFLPDGTGWLTLDNNGTLSPIIPFNHTLTAANGYTIFDNVPFFANNSRQVDVNSIDFSSQVTIDPNANVTLPAKPNISPHAVLQYGSLLPSPQTTTTTPVPNTPSSPTSPSVQPQQPLNPTPPTTTTPSESSGHTGVIIDRPTAARLAAEDPYFARFEEILANCNNLVFGTATITLEQCATSLQDGADRWCGFEFYDQLKCQYASFMAQQYNKMVGTLGGNLFNDLFPEGLLAPTP